MSLPYMSSPGNIPKAFAAIKAAAVPNKVSQDFVMTVLKIPGGSGAQMTTFLKKLGFVSPDGAPTEAYRKFRNPGSSAHTVAEAVKHAYRDLYVRNEYMHELPDDQLLGLIVEVTGDSSDSAPARLTLSCLKQLKSAANFSDHLDAVPTYQSEPKALTPIPESGKPDTNIGLNLGYTINLNLPATSDPNVFDAIFKSLREHLLRADDV